MRSLLVEGLSETEPKENENISRQQLAVGREWSPLKKFPTHCTAITIVSMIALQFRSFFSCIFVICYHPLLQVRMVLIGDSGYGSNTIE
ncbi:hypothetical protein CISIN_1g041935mg [Citrus sinensis]|uniref:Uncharacterized protein n=1 Tax=Citrus sinensis TaxID=2711 RepID=A0A067DAK0_CITSI|nr:hypothetical protein CISIN_1g041935mg [Citrus sinensis]